jgi:thioredoxin-like negative regulator of GroEL
MTDETYEKQLQADRYLLYGLLDQAEALYGEVLQAEPRNGEAAFGMARVALERGEEQTAYERVQVAVSLDPGNDDAQRLARRLREILEARRSGPPAASRPQSAPPAEQASFARNRSMADHRAEESRRNAKK